jgi:hypothetical protein
MKDRVERATEGAKATAELIKIWVEIVAIVCAGGWAAYTFIFAEYFKGPQFLTLEAELTQLPGCDDGLEAANVHIKIRNTSARRVQVLNSHFEVYGDQIVSVEPGKMDASKYQGALNNGGGNARFVAGFKHATTTFVAGGSFGAQDWLDPGDEQPTNFLVYVPRGHYSQLELNTYLLSGEEARQPYVKTSVTLVNSQYAVDWSVPDQKTGQYVVPAGEMAEQFNKDREESRVDSVLRLNHQCSLSDHQGSDP